MNFVGIIAEYDPFHSGHALQLRMLRQRGASTIAVCMSTGVVQRGGVPILPEAVRVRAALAAGADLVVALPAPYANASAEQFAAAGVHLLAALGCDTLAFGAETPEPAPLQAAAAALCSAAFPAALRSQLESGLPFAAARAAAAETLCPGAADLLQTPNNILGIEYCKAILRQGAAPAASGRSPWHRPDRPGAGAGTGFGFPYPAVGAYARNQGCQPLCAAGSHGAVPPGRGTRSAGGPGKVQHRSADFAAHQNAGAAEYLTWRGRRAGKPSVCRSPRSRNGK